MARTKRRKKRTHVLETAEGTKKAGPKTFVFWRGRHGPLMKPLEADLRKMMSPNTASNLRESKRNSMRDFVDLAGPLGVTHFFVLTMASAGASYLRVARCPRGPTVALKIDGYSLCRDVLSSQARPRAPEEAWRTPPLVVIHNFGGGGGSGDGAAEGTKRKGDAAAADGAAVGGGDLPSALSLLATLFRGAFPAIDVRTTRLSTCKRVVLLSHAGEGKVSLRHFSISARPAGASAAVCALVGKKQVPDLSKAADVSDFLLSGSGSVGGSFGAGYGSESDAEGGEANRVELDDGLRPTRKSRTRPPSGPATSSAASARIRVHELGPRIDATVVKAEGGLCGGPVLYHAHYSKSAAEVAAGYEERKGKEASRAARRAEQEANVRRKRVAAAAAAEAAAAAAAKKRGGDAEAATRAKKETRWWEEEEDEGRKKGGGGGDDGGAPSPSSRHGGRGGDDDDDDVAAYREAVGEEPTSLAGLVPRSGGRGGGRGRGGRGRGVGGSRGRGRGGGGAPPSSSSFSQRNKRGSSGPVGGGGKRGRH